MGKVLDNNMFASRAGALVRPRRPLGLPHAAEDGRVLDGGSGVPLVPVVCMPGTLLAVLPSLQQQQGEMAGVSVSLGTPTAFPFQQHTGYSCHGCSLAHRLMFPISVSASLSLRLSLRPSF